MDFSDLARIKKDTLSNTPGILVPEELKTIFPAMANFYSGNADNDGDMLEEILTIAGLCWATAEGLLSRRLQEEIEKEERV